jgi:AraC-like DNA-binding protein/quercetin dioxygenase-like cupin family protein
MVGGRVLVPEPVGDRPTIRLARRTLSPAHRFPRHAHEAWSFAVVLSGAGYVRSAGTVHRAGAGAITVLHPGESHDGWTHTADGLDYLVLTVAADASHARHGRGGTPSFPDRVVADAAVAAALRRGHGEAVELAVRRLFRRYSRGRHPDADLSPVTAAARRRMDAQYHRSTTLAELADLADVSTATLVRHFRAETGLAPYEYLVSRRVDAATSLLAQGRTVTEVAALTGFADQSHLHRHFRRITGVTPGRFRASHHDGR